MFLWDGKLKSRASFLLIIEFLDVKRKQLQGVLPLMKKVGDKFFSKYIENNVQFWFHGIRTRNVITSGSVVQTNDPVFSPSSG
jgi:hypothetical protein